MSSTEMNVSLDLNAPHGSSRIGVGDSTGQNSISVSSTPTTIVWNLTGALADVADFVPMDAAMPGFQWAFPIGQQGGPPAGLFDNPIPVISNNGNTLTVTDNHLGSSTNGQWIYILRVLYRGTVYSTQFSPGADQDDGGYESDGSGDPTGTVKNPVIVNR